MSAASLALGLLLPWLLGIALLLAARDPEGRLDAPGETAWLAGAGYLVGVIALTLWMRALSLTGIRFGVLSIGLPLLGVAAGCAWYASRPRGARTLAQELVNALHPPADVAGALRVLWWLLMGWLALRFAVLALEISWRPLYPWDAWIEWATKARVWFELGRIAPFVDAPAWFAATDPAWFDASPRNPATLPLLQVWSCIALGRWDDALMNWPWWQIAVALALVMYGGLRRLGLGAFAAFLGAFFVASLPLGNVHVALAGYADLPLAAWYTMAVLAFLRWTSTRTMRAFAAAVLFALLCPLIKIFGIVWSLTLVPGLVVALMPRRGNGIAAALLGCLLFLLAVLAQTHPVVGGYALHLDFAPAWNALTEVYLISGTWNLLWYGALGAACLSWRHLLAPALAPLTFIVATGVLLLLALFAFPGLARLLDDWPTLARATLHFAPLTVVFMLCAFRAFAMHWQDKHPAPEAPVTAAPAP